MSANRRTHLQNDRHDVAVDVSRGSSAAFDTPEPLLRVDGRRLDGADAVLRASVPRCRSPVPASSTDASTATASSVGAPAGAPCMRPASPPSKQNSVPRAAASATRGATSPTHYYDAAHDQLIVDLVNSQQKQQQHNAIITPSGAYEALRELDESMGELYHGTNEMLAEGDDTSSTRSAVGNALQEVCDRLEFLSEIVLSHERRLAEREARVEEVLALAGGSPRAAAASPLQQQQRENRELVNSILHKVEAVEHMMLQVRSSAQSSPAGSNKKMMQMQQQQDTSYTTATSASATSSSSARKQHKSDAVVATIASAMQSISKQLETQTQLIHHVVANQYELRHRAIQAPAMSESDDNDNDDYISNPVEDCCEAEYETASNCSAPAEIVDAVSPPHFSVPRERTPEALAVTKAESCQRRMEQEFVSPSARLLVVDTDEDLDGDEDDSDADEEEEEYDQAELEAMMDYPRYNDNDDDEDRSSSSVSNDGVDVEVEEENDAQPMEDASPRRAVYAAVDALAESSAPGAAGARSPAGGILGIAGSPEAKAALIHRLASPPRGVLPEEEEHRRMHDEDEDEEEADYTEDEYTEQYSDEDSDKEVAHFHVAQQAQRRSPSHVAEEVSPARVRTPAAYIDTAQRAAAVIASSGGSAARTAAAPRATVAPASAPAAVVAGPAAMIDASTASAGSSPSAASTTTTVANMTPQPAFLVRSALRGDFMSAEKQPERRALFDQSDSESDAGDEQVVLELVDKKPRSSVNNTTTTSSAAAIAAQQDCDESENGDESRASTGFSESATVTVPAAMLQRLLDELENVRAENSSLRAQLEHAFRRNDIVSERLLELSPAR